MKAKQLSFLEKKNISGYSFMAIKITFCCKPLTNTNLPQKYKKDLTNSVNE